MFYDRAKIHVAAGNGGNGCISFRREKHVPRGGPDGGDGGRGGDVIVAADPQKRDLQLFTYKVHFKAGAGQAGQGARKHGANGETAVVPVPLGTQIRVEDELGDRLIADMVYLGQKVVVARGGAGGHGNARFVNSVRQAPKFAELGEEGEAGWLRLSLKLMADAGLAGLPNAGKSSLLRRFSNAKPKVADYPFTTVEPMLGVVDWSGENDMFTLADVPGLLEGAGDGVGLGHEFLAHLERCRLLLHVVDLTGYYGAGPLEGFRTILAELDAHATGLGEKPQVVVLNKIDALPTAEVEEQVEVFVAEVERLRAAGHPAFTYVVGDDEPLSRQLVWAVSAVTGAGLTGLLRWVGPLLEELRTPEIEAAGAEPGETRPWDTAAVSAEIDDGHVLYRPAAIGQASFTVHKQKHGFVVRGEKVRRLVSRFDLTNEEAIRYLGERLDRLGVYAALRAQGAQPGDDVDIEGYAFEYQ
ncbi:MAG: GTPase ObgE [Actinobacteria bacterium]|jgi:GTP-binding protein|nr:GTPase ObgE [Actinomycetota bacterium]